MGSQARVPGEGPQDARALNGFSRTRRDNAKRKDNPMSKHGKCLLLIAGFLLATSCVDDPVAVEDRPLHIETADSDLVGRPGRRRGCIG